MGDVRIANVRLMQSDDLANVLSWRNHQDVRRYMYTSREITTAEHAAWFESARYDATRQLLIFEINRQPSGFVNFKHLPEAASAIWGFYLAPGVPKGTGKILGQVAMNYAFDVLILKNVYAEVLGFNERSIKFHHRLGFALEHVKPKFYFDGQDYHDVHCFSLSREEWAKLNGEAIDE